MKGTGYRNGQKSKNQYQKILLRKKFTNKIHQSQCFKSVIQSGRSLFLSKIKIHRLSKFTCGFRVEDFIYKEKNQLQI
jgi:hypothetical protein